MDIYGFSAPPDFFPFDDLLDFSNDNLFSNSSTTSTTPATSTVSNHHDHPLSTHNLPITPPISTDITSNLCLPTDELAELEWLSQFVDNSLSDLPAKSVSGTQPLRPDSSFTDQVSPNLPEAGPLAPVTGKMKVKERSNKGQAAEGPSMAVRRCTHCASEKTPQWRTGPLGPKTLCNACGVRYKSGRLVPEYRPAASPTFVLTQHSNSHRKVMELRRQKELMKMQKQQQMLMQQQHEKQHERNGVC